MLRNEIALVDIFDNFIEKTDKDTAHKKGLLHRAFSIFIYKENMMLIQRRALNKYHSSGLWTNACCSHPGPNDDLIQSAKERLVEEVGIVCSLEELFTFCYYYKFDDNLYEYEYDHVFIGEYSGPCVPDLEEVSELKWISFNELSKEIIEFPQKYTPWFLSAVPEVIKRLSGNYITG